MLPHFKTILISLSLWNYELQFHNICHCICSFMHVDMSKTRKVMWFVCRESFRSQLIKALKNTFKLLFIFIFVGFDKLIVRARPLSKLCEFDGNPLPEDYKSDCYHDVDESDYACKEKTRIMVSW